MKTNFKNYLKKKNAQNLIDKFAKNYEGKKIILYGVNLFSGDLFRNYDLSKLNIIGVSDQNFQNDSGDDYYGYKKFKADQLFEIDFDILLITAYDDLEIKFFLKNELLKGKNEKFKIRTLIRMNLFEYIRALINGDF